MRSEFLRFAYWKKAIRRTGSLLKTNKIQFEIFFLSGLTLLRCNFWNSIKLGSLIRWVSKYKSLESGSRFEWIEKIFSLTFWGFCRMSVDSLEVRAFFSGGFVETESFWSVEDEWGTVIKEIRLKFQLRRFFWDAFFQRNLILKTLVLSSTQERGLWEKCFVVFVSW